MRIFWICPSSWRTPPCTSVWASSKPAVAPGPPLGKHPYVLHPAAAREVRSQPGSGLCWWLCCEGFACIPQPRLCLLHLTACVPLWWDWGAEAGDALYLVQWHRRSLFYLLSSKIILASRLWGKARSKTEREQFKLPETTQNHSWYFL